MNTDEITPLSNALTTVSSVDAIWAIIARAAPSFRDGNVTSVAEASFAAQISLRALRIGENKDADIAKFVEWNAKIAMSMPASGEPMLRIQVQESRDYIGKFIRSVGWPLRLELTEIALRLAGDKLRTHQHNPACWLINSVGWRSDPIVAKLWDAARAMDDEGGDIAFSVLIELGVPKSKRSLYLKEAHRRYKERKLQSNLFAIGHLASPTSLAVLALPNSWKDKEELTYFQTAPAIIAMIADQSDGKAIPTKAVKIFKSLLQADREKASPAIYMQGNVASHCNSDSVTELLLDLLIEDGENTKPGGNGIFLLLHRLEDCIRPNQLAGYEKKKNSIRLKKLIGRIVGKANIYQGRTLTYEGDIKDRFWNLSLMIGSPESLPLALKVLENDQNVYSQFKALQDLACFSLRPIPKPIAKWIAGAVENDGIEENGHALLGSAALRIAWSSESEEGFQLLLDSRFTHNGHTLADSADGLAHLAVHLAHDGNTRRGIVNKIFEKFDASPTAPTSGMVCAAIYALGHARFLSNGDYKKLHSAILGKTPWMDNFDKSRIISAIGTGPANLLVGDLQNRLIEFTKTGDERLATASFEALIEAGLVEELPNQSLSRLGLSRSSGKWSFKLAEGNRQPNGGLLVMLLRKNRDLFTEAFSSFLEFSPFRSFVQAVEALNRTSGKKSIPFASEFTQALLRRAQVKNTLFDAEPYVFRCLAIHDYRAFTEQDWSSKLKEWPAESREALGSAFLVRPFGFAELSFKGEDTLATLQSDPSFGVRRAAFRSLGTLSPALLTLVVRNLRLSESPAARILAAEAIYWVSPSDRKDDWWKSLGRLSTDTARDVRQALEKSKSRAEKLRWAQLYLSWLVAPINTNDPNSDVLQRWKYAQAIVHLGDDQTAQQLRQYLQAVLLPASYQRFLIKTIETLEKNWTKCRSKWPEPMFAGQASLSLGEGNLIVDREKLPGQFVVWRNLDVVNSSILTFGGTIVLTAQTKHTDLLGKPLGLEFSDGTQIKIWIHQIENQKRLSFGGQEDPDDDPIDFWMQSLHLILECVFDVAGKFSTPPSPTPVELKFGDATAVLFPLPELLFIYPTDPKVMPNHGTEERYFAASDTANTIFGHKITENWRVYEIQRTYVPGVVRIHGLTRKPKGLTVDYKAIDDDDRNLILKARTADLGLLKPCYDVLDKI